MYTKVSVVIATLNENEFIGRLIDSINSCDYPNKEIIVVDGGSSDGTVEIAEKKGAIIIEEEGEPRGPSHARNQGVQYSDADVVCVMDADEFVENGFLSNAMCHFKDPDVVAVKPGKRSVFIDNLVEELHAKTVHMKKDISSSLYGEPHDSIISGESSDPIPKFYFWRRKVWLDIGGHPESAGWKELVIFKKKARRYLNENNYRAVIEPNSCMYFHMQHNWQRLFKSFRWYGRSMIDYFRTDEDLGVREILANLHQVGIFLLLPFLFVPVSPIRLLALVLFSVRFLISFPFAVKEGDYKYLGTPIIDILGGLGILVGLIERVRGRRLTRG